LANSSWNNRQCFQDRRDEPIDFGPRSPETEREAGFFYCGAKLTSSAQTEVMASIGGFMKQWEDNLLILESIANSFDKNSVQYKAIEEAAQALIFLNMHKELKKAYEKFRTQSDKELSKSQKKHLRDMGIEL
jgi:hypothetical protein